MPGEHSYHNAMATVDTVPFTIVPWQHGDRMVNDYGDAKNEANFPHSDLRWPTHCVCGYAFVESDRRQIFFDDLMRRTDTGEEMTLRDAPAGAMWDAWWYGGSAFPTPPRPDGIHLMVRTPDGEWYVDGLASNGPRNDYGWQRSGDPKAIPPTITAKPSIQMGAVGSSSYHGWLRDGKLVDA